MGLITLISWCDHTFSPVRGCVHEGLNTPEGSSLACDNCYAETMSHRNLPHMGHWGFEAPRKFAAESYWRQPLAWQAAAEANGEIKLVFCASLADVFEGEPPADPAGVEGRNGPRADYLPMLDRLRDLAPLTPNLRYLMLTKRPWNALALYRKWGAWPKTWWMGFTAENQMQLNRRAPYALEIPAEVTFVSVEPMLGPLDLKCILDHRSDHFVSVINGLDGTHGTQGGTWTGQKIGWVIDGFESGPHARPSHSGWSRKLRDQCAKAGVPYHHKQNGEFIEVQPADARTGDLWLCPRGKGSHPNAPELLTQLWREGDEGAVAGRWDVLPDVLVRRVGKKAAGHLLDGVEHLARPDVG